MILIKHQEKKAVFILICLLVLCLAWGTAHAVPFDHPSDTDLPAGPIRPLSVKTGDGPALAQPLMQSIRETKPVEQAKSAEEREVQGTEAGVFKVTAYCPCEICNGKWAGQPAKNGEELQEGMTIAVDPDVIPLGSYVYIEGVGKRKAQDTGSAITGNEIDLFLGTHGETEEWGVKYLKVYWIK